MKNKPIDFKNLSPEIEKRKDGKHKLGYRGAYISKSGLGIPSVKIKLKGESYILSRVVWCITHKHPIPDGMIVDHEDGNPMNNEPSNLRLATYKTNNWNKKRQRNNKTGVCGVCAIGDGNKWVATFGKGSKNTKKFNDFFEAICYRKSLENKSTRITERHGQ